MLQQLTNYLDDLRKLRALIKAEKTKTIAKQAIRDKAKTLSSDWLSQIGPRLASADYMHTDSVDKYTNLFRDLLRITGPSNLKSRYEEILKSIVKDFRKELILPLHEQPATSAPFALLSALFKELSLQEDSYMKEAIGCAKSGFLKASVVLGWCAVVDRIHRKIEEVGFSVFNITSQQMASQQKGRFKKFDAGKVQNIQSISELREVYDTVLLWIIEGMGLIESNQHTRLSGCFVMRCQSAHPGDAPITEYNLLSFYSDIKEIVLENPKFQIAATNPGETAS